MTERLKGVLPLAIAVGVLTLLWVEVSLNFTFHWVTSGDLGNGLALPANVHLITPAAFISWAFFFAAGADRAAAGKVLVGSAIGTVGALLLMWLSPRVADVPDFWGIAVIAAAIALVVVAVSAVSERYYTPAVFGGFATVVFWWIATGLDGWAPGGGGASNTVESLAKPTTAGTGAFGGVLSTPYGWVFVSCLVSLARGVVLGLASTTLAGLGARRPQTASTSEPETSRV